MKVLRYLTFEIGRSCFPDMVRAHRTKCPIACTERFKFSKSRKPITNERIFEFWSWARTEHGFRGLVKFEGYAEPTLEADRIRRIMIVMKETDPNQAFQITTSVPGEYPEFDLVKISNYSGSDRGLSMMDNRIQSIRGEGDPYEKMNPTGHCARGLGWEVWIDYYGNWWLCCADFRCEEAFGSIMIDSWEGIYQRWTAKRKTIRWKNREEYEALPRMCRSCIKICPSLSNYEKLGI